MNPRELLSCWTFVLLLVLRQHCQGKVESETIFMLILVEFLRENYECLGTWGMYNMVQVYRNRCRRRTILSPPRMLSPGQNLLVDSVPQDIIRLTSSRNPPPPIHHGREQNSLADQKIRACSHPAEHCMVCIYYQSLVTP